MLLQRPGGHSRYTEGQFNWLFPLASSSISSLLRCRDELNWDWPFHNVLFNLISASVAGKSWIWIDLSINVLFYLISADVAEKSRIWIDAESRPTLPPSFWAQPSEVAVLFDLNLSRLPFHGQVVDFRSAALHRIQFGTCGFVPMSYFYSDSETKEWLKDWAQQGDFGQQQLLANSIKNFISHEKKID